MSNLEFWNKVCTTDPKHTKKVTMGRTFTAIDPMYQIMRATEEMGVAGNGWGFEVMEHVFLPTDEVAIKVRVWKGDRANYIEQWGQNGLYTDNAKSKTDKDCMKKATTDGLTKGLTYFGFNADVFLGKFDDNKYVEELLKKQAEPKPETPKELSLRLIAALEKVVTTDKLRVWEKVVAVKDARDGLFMSNPDLSRDVDDALEKHYLKLKA